MKKPDHANEAQRELQDLLVECQDEHSDAMSAMREPLSEMVELGHEQRAASADEQRERTDSFTNERRRLLTKAMLGTGALATAGFGSALMALFERPAFADTTTDIQILQTAASLENLAVATYDAALALPFVGGADANGVIKAFATMTKGQHAEHAKAFNAAAVQLGGKPQDRPDPVLLDVVEKAKPGLTDASAVVALALQLEVGATQTYVVNTSALDDLNARKVTASVMGVEAQHVAILRAVQALLAGKAPQLIALPPDASALPAPVGNVGFPDGFFKTDEARPAAEGAVQ